jgi:hypothetical protein
VSRRRRNSGWAKLIQRSVSRVTRLAVSTGSRAVKLALKPVSARSKPPAGAGSWKLGLATGPGGMRRFRLYRPPAVGVTERLPLLVIHGAADEVVALANAQGAIRLWAGAAGAQAGSVRQVRRGRRLPMAVTDYKRGSAAVATLVVVDDLGHAWSGGLASQPFSDGRGPDASRMVWSFAARQFRR